MRNTIKTGPPKNNLAGLLSEQKALAKRAQSRAGLAEVAALLLQVRHELKLTQKELADRCGVPKSTISEIENTANDGITLRTLVKIAKGAGACLSLGFQLDPESAGRVSTSLKTGSYNFRSEARQDPEGAALAA